MEMSGMMANNTNNIGYIVTLSGDCDWIMFQPQEGMILSSDKKSFSTTDSNIPNSITLTVLPNNTAKDRKVTLVVIQDDNPKYQAFEIRQAANSKIIKKAKN